MTTINESSLTTFDGLNLYTKEWIVDNAKADIVFTHGFFEHCSRYDTEARYFNSHGYNFIAYDQRTHGQSDGKYRSYVDNFSAYSKDYDAFLTSLNLGKERPYFLFAHSMGGLVQVTHVIEKSNALPSGYCGSIYSAPLLAPDPNTAPLLQKVSGIVGTLFPRLKAVAIDPNAVSRDPKEVQKYVEDPLNYTDKMYAASGYHLLKQMKTLPERFEKIDSPFLLIHSEADQLSDISGSELFFEQSKAADRTFMRLKKYSHEMTKDLGKEKILESILDWMEKRF